MFGLEKDKLKHFEFDLEKKIKNKKERKKISDHLEMQVQHLKTRLRAGTDTKTYDTLGTLLQSYMSLKQFLNRTAK
ncbi:MAG: DUF5398 family protein [Simkaniaceae bacterium]|nr:DUF5398 family protein [Simkaniaceae bacterium]